MNQHSLLYAIPDGVFSVNYTVFENDREIASIDRKLMSLHLKGSITVNGVTHQISHDSVFSKRFRMESPGGTTEATATITRWFHSSVEIEYSGRILVLKKKYFSLKTKFLLFINEIQAGEIRLIKLFSRRLLLETQMEIPLEIRAFILWLAILFISAESSESSSSNS